jgi:branched-chain amino acid transport system permease protein
MANIFSRNKKLFWIIAALVIIAIIPLFVTSPYYLDLVIITMIYSVLAMTFVLMLRTGLISMAVAAFWGIGAYISLALVMFLHLSFWLALPLSGMLTGAAALILGFPLIKNAGFTFIILTSVIGMLFGVAFGNISELNGWVGMSNIPRPDQLPFLPNIDWVSKVPNYYLCFFISIISVLIIWAFYAAWTGRAWTAIGLNSRLAESLGINVFRYKLIGFIVSSAVAGLLGSFYAHYQTFVAPGTFDMFKTIYFQIYAILGGIGFAILGPIVGSTIMVFFPQLISMSKEWGPIFLGVLVVLLILFLPRGLLSLTSRGTVVGEGLIRVRKAIESSLSAKNKAEKHDT